MSSELLMARSAEALRRRAEKRGVSVEVQAARDLEAERARRDKAAAPKIEKPAPPPKEKAAVAAPKASGASGGHESPIKKPAASPANELERLTAEKRAAVEREDFLGVCAGSVAALALSEILW